MLEHWAELDVEPASIPHLLHWDYAYLWALDQPDDQLSEQWQRRVKGWRQLLVLLLGGELKHQVAAIPTRFQSYLKDAGVEEVRELRLKDSDEVIGILSPVTIVRPLPDEGEFSHAFRAPQRERASAVNHYLKLLGESLKDAAANPDRPNLKLLKKVIDRFIRERGAFETQTKVTSSDEELKILLQADFRPHPGLTTAAVPITVYVFDRAQRLFVPRCNFCGKPLTRENKLESSISVESQFVRIRCEETSCQKDNDFDLSHLFLGIQKAAGTEPPVLLLWIDRKTLGDEAAGQEFPPNAEIDGDEVRFSWPTGAVDGKASKHTLRFRFAGFQRRQISFDDCFFNRVVVPGIATKGFQGVPLRQAYAQFVSHWPTVRTVGGDLVYRDWGLTGLPFKVQLYYGPSRQHHEPELGVAVYPKRMHSSWKEYRLMLTGKGQQFRVSCPAGTSVWKALATSELWPDEVFVESADSPNEGVCWKRASEVPPAAAAIVTLNVGIDFGTTCTVVAFEKDASNLVLRRDDILDCVDWVAEPQSALPSLSGLFPHAGQGSADQTLIPSALWISRPAKWAGLRWSEQRPDVADVSAEKEFKWREGEKDPDKLRVRYLQELLFWLIPAIQLKLRCVGSQCAASLGFAFPLAFSHPQRQSMRDMLTELRVWSRDRLGITADMHSISESMGCVRAIGKPAPGDYFLIADLGGGSLDVALISDQDAEKPSQVGSVRFGGEICIKSLSKSDGGEEYWRLRDSLAAGRPDSAFSSPDAVRILDKHNPIALEFLRTMIEAFRAADAESKVQIVLVGNGWRLRSLAVPQADPNETFRNYFQRMFKSMGVSNLTFRDERVADNPKHIVALGALLNARSDKFKEIDAKTVSGILPAGRNLRVHGETIGWSTMLGPGGWKSDLTAAHVTDKIEWIQMKEGPPVPDAWSPHLEQALPKDQNRYPTEEKVRELLKSSVVDHSFGKGPLQIILEDHWGGKI